MALLRNFGGLVFRLDRNGPVVSDIEPYIAGLFRVHFLELLVCLIPLEGLHFAASGPVLLRYGNDRHRIVNVDCLHFRSVAVGIDGHDRNAVLEVLVERHGQGRAAVADPV